jgi:hypothetical protein
MSSMRLNVSHDMSHYRPLHLFKDAEIVVGSLTGIPNAVVKCLFVDNRNCIHESTSKNPEGSNVASVEAMQFGLP